MSTPRRRQSPAVYRRRRLAVVSILLVVVAAIVLAIWQPWRAAAWPGAAGPAPSGSGAPAASAPAAEAPSPSETPPASETPASEAEGDGTAPEESSPEPSASGSATPIPACTTGAITVLAVTDKEAYGAGELPQLSITLSNTSSEPCLINVGTAKQSFVVTSGSDTWWRSTDCQSESSDQVVQLAAGQTVSSVTPLTWDRTRSSTDTCDATDRPAAPAGYFHLQVSIGGIDAADTKMFRLR